MDRFDKLLYEGSAQMPPALPGPELPRPWKKPMGRICWGLALIGLTLNFFGLDIILPAVGTVLLWLGLRSLRRENGGFRFAYACATAYAVLRLAAVVLRATPFDLWLAELIGGEWHTAGGEVPLYHALRTVAVQLVLVLTVGGLWQGLKGVFRRVGQKPRTAAAGGLVVLESVMIPLALIGLEGWLLVGPVLLVWILLLWSLWKLSRSLDEAGYALAPAPVRCPGGVAFGLWLGIPLLAAALLPLCFSRLPVDDTTPVYGPDVRDEALYRELLDLGFPEDLLSKLGGGRMALLQGAYGLTGKGWPLSSGGYPDGIPQTVVLEVPVRDEKYGFRNVYLAYVYWGPEEHGGYMEGIQIAPDWHGVTVHTTIPQGELEWRDSGGVSHTAPLTFGFRSGGSGMTAYYADLSLPEDVDGPVEGWIYWEAAPSFPEAVKIFNYSVKFAHRRSPWQYPYELPSDILAANAMGQGWRTYQWISEGQMAPEGEYDPARISGGLPQTAIDF